MLFLRCLRRRIPQFDIAFSISLKLERASVGVVQISSFAARKWYFL